MKRAIAILTFLSLVVLPTALRAQDWPQWRGQNRDAKVSGFTPPATWPEELTQQWSVDVGDGVSTPCLVGDKMYVFARQGGDEVILCLNAASGEEIWRDSYSVGGADGPASGFAGPRSSPAVANGMVCTFGVRGTVSCLNAESGDIVWRKDAEDWFPRFYTSSSPIIVDGKCVCQLGGEQEGAIVAYDLASGDQAWTWDGDGTAYASPVLMEISGKGFIIAETANKILAVDPASGAIAWEMDYAVTGRGYNASTPTVVGDTLVFSGSNRGTQAVKLSLEGDTVTSTDVWNNGDNSVQYNSPIVKGDLVFGLTARDSLYCVNAASGETVWSQQLEGGGRRSRGYGNIVDAGDVLFFINPSSQLVVFKPTAEYEEVARYQVSEGETYAYPIIAGNRIYIKDDESLMLFTLE